MRAGRIYDSGTTARLPAFVTGYGKPSRVSCPLFEVKMYSTSLLMAYKCRALSQRSAWNATYDCCTSPTAVSVPAELI